MKRARLCLLAGFVLLGALLSRSTVRAEDRVTIRGAYYREPSTRVIQPVVEITKDLPHGFDINAHYLVDTITSASAAAGTSVDSIFTEIRSEVGLGVGKTWDRTRATLSYKYSAESDYWSHAFWASLSRTFWGNTATVGAFGGFSLDSVGFRTRTPSCLRGGRFFLPARTRRSAASGTRRSCRRWPSRRSISTPPTSTDSWPTPTVRSRASGPRSFPTSASGRAVSVRGAYYFPEIETGLQIQYRYYRDFYPGALPPGVTQDPWGLSASMVEGRVYHQLSRDLEVRFLYRQYFQQPPAFWCDVPANVGCSPMSMSVSPTYASSDPAIGPVRTEYPEVKLMWDAASLESIPFFRWFAAGTFEISYGRYFQNNSFGDAHVLQTGYSMPY